MKKIPCKSTCPKCGSKNIHYTFVYSDLNWRDRLFEIENNGGIHNPQLSNEFVQVYGIYKIYLQDCIRCFCNCCEYIWQIKPLT